MKLARIITLITALAPLATLGQGTAFTYQGQLVNNGSPANGIYDFRFRLASDSQGNNYVGSPFTNALGVTNGLFMTTIDFGSVFTAGADFWVEIDVRTNGASGYEVLSPLQPVTPTPFAMFATTASNLIGTLNASQLTGTLSNASFSGTYASAVTLNNVNNIFTGSFVGNGSGLTNLSAWGLGGNTGTSGGLDYLGTADDQPLELRVNAMRAMRFEFGGVSSYLAAMGATNLNGAPNVLGGSPINYVTPGCVGVVIGGGGVTNYAGNVFSNSVSADFGAIVGGADNQIQAYSLDAFIGGGYDNMIQSSNSSAVISGGAENEILTGSGSTFIGGGFDNVIESYCGEASIGAGEDNLIQSGSYSSTIGGGYGNQILTNANDSVIAGGAANVVQSNSNFGTIPGGAENEIMTNSQFCTIGGGQQNVVEPGSYSSIIGGGYENIIDGSYAAIPGGTGNFATNNALGAGHGAQATNQGAFVWADDSGGNFSSRVDNEFAARAAGGVRFTSGNTGAAQSVSWVPGAGSWAFTSDRNTKEDIKPIDPQAVLEKLSRVSIWEWNYIGYEQRHLGPMAQDFHEQFPLNKTDTTLNETDLHGVALAAIQGLNQKLEAQLKERDAEIQALKVKAEQVDSMEKRLNELARTVQSLSEKN